MASPPVMKTPSGRQVELPKAFGLQNTGTVIGDYLIGTLEGQGAFGAFYRVTRNGGDQSELYGLKLSLQALCQYQGGDRDEFAARAGRELAALAGLRHPNIVKVRAFGTWPHDLGYPYLVTDFVEGSHLNSWRRKSHPSVMKMCALIAKVADACAYFHGLGLYHRDLKSENVLVRHSDGEPIIIDFGISRQALDDGVTRAGYTLGTRTHYAPEYVEFIGSDAFYKGMPFPWNVSADLYAIGIMAYEMFTGQMPWSGARDEQELYAQIRTVPPPLPSLRVPALPGAIDNIVMRLLAKRPEERFGSGAELADAFRRAMDDGRGVEEWEAPLDIPEGGSNEAPTGRPRRRAPVLDHDLAESALEMASVLAAAEARAGAGVASSFPAAMSGVTKEAVPSAASRPVGFAPPESDGAKSFVSPVPALLRANEKKAGVEDVPEPHIAPVSEVREGDWEAIRGRGPGELPAPLAPATPAPRARAKPSAAKPQEVDVEDGGIGFRAPTTVKPAFSSISPPPTARGPKEGDVDPNTPGGKGMFFNTQIRLQAASLRGTGAERKPKWLLLGGVSLVAVFLLFLFFAARGGDRSNEPRSNLLAEAEKQRKEAESGVVPPPTTVVARDVSPLSGSNQKTFGAEGATGKTPENVTGGLALGGPPPPVPSLGLPPPPPPGGRRAGEGGAIDRELHQEFGRPNVGPGPTAPVDNSPFKRSKSMVASAPAVAKKGLGVPLGSHITVKLLSNLDSRTLSGAPVEAMLTAPFIVDDRVVIPARTVFYGSGSAGGGRFTVRFNRARLPDNTEVEVEGLALDRADRKAGLVASRRIDAAQDTGPGLGQKVAKGAASTALGAVSGGGLAGEMAKGAGSEVINNQEYEGGGQGGSAILLDAPVLFVLFASRAF